MKKLPYIFYLVFGVTTPEQLQEELNGKGQHADNLQYRKLMWEMVLENKIEGVTCPADLIPRWKQVYLRIIVHIKRYSVERI